MREVGAVQHDLSDPCHAFIKTIGSSITEFHCLLKEEHAFDSQSAMERVISKVPILILEAR